MLSEGNVTISERPFVTIADKPLGECSTQEVAKELMRLCKRVDELRASNKVLREQLTEKILGSKERTFRNDYVTANKEVDE